MKIKFRTLLSVLAIGFLMSVHPTWGALTDGLISHVNFDGDNFLAAPVTDGTGSYLTFADKSTEGNPATCYRNVNINGTIYYMNQCPAATTGPDNSLAADFYGTLCDVQSDHLGIANAPELTNLTRGSIALWVLYHGGSVYRQTYLINNYENFKPGTWHLGRGGTVCNLFEAHTKDGIPTRIFVFPDSELYSGSYETWNHLAVTWDGTTIRGYFNGTLFVETSQAEFPSFNEGTYITIGALNHSNPRNMKDNNCVLYYGGDPTQTYVQPNAGFMNGKMDDIRIYNRALSSEEISQLADLPLRRDTYILKVIKQGTGLGAVTSSRRGISCGNYCSEAYVPGTSLYLTALPSPGSSFVGWSGPCSGTGRCDLSPLNQDLIVTARFDSTLEDVAAFEAEATAFTNPFVAKSNYIVQPGWTTTTPANGGRVEFNFTLNEPSDVLVIGNVNCPSTGNDSFFVNMDQDPTDPTMIWDIGSTVRFMDRIVRWRGNGTSDTPAIDPKWWTLAAGQHKLIIVGRETLTQLNSVKIMRRSATGAAQTPVSGFGPFKNTLKINDPVGMVIPIHGPLGATYHLKLYDRKGRLVTTVEEGSLIQTPQMVLWNGRNDNGAFMASGIYILKLEIGGESVTKKVVVVK